MSRWNGIAWTLVLAWLSAAACPGPGPDEETSPLACGAVDIQCNCGTLNPGITDGTVQATTACESGLHQFHSCGYACSAYGTAWQTTCYCGGDAGTCPAIVTQEFAAQELAAEDLRRDPCHPVSTNEAMWCDSNDQQLQAFPATWAWTDAVQRLKDAAEIASDVAVGVTPDLALTPMQAGGGVTGSSLIVLDGKFLDIVSEYANYLALAAAGQTAISRNEALNAIVAAHDSVLGTAPPSYFPASQLDAAGLQAAQGFFDDFAGALLFHEYGHYWTWACVERVRQNYSPASAMFYNLYPSLMEDDADFIAGALSAKAGHDRERAQEMIDLMAFYFLYRAGQASDIAAIEQSYLQVISSNPSYSSLATRKSLIARGFTLYLQNQP